MSCRSSMRPGLFLVAVIGVLFFVARANASDYHNIDSFLDIFIGESNIVAKVVKGFFADPGIEERTKNNVYQSLTNAREKTEKAKVAGRTLDEAKLKVPALLAIKSAATELQENPDDTTAKEAEVVSMAMDALIIAAMAKVNVEEIKAIKDAAVKDVEKARAAGDEKRAVEAEEVVKRAEKTLARETKALERSEKAARDALEGAAQHDLLKVMAAVKDAEEALMETEAFLLETKAFLMETKGALMDKKEPEALREPVPPLPPEVAEPPIWDTEPTSPT